MANKPFIMQISKRKPFMINETFLLLPPRCTFLPPSPTFTFISVIIRTNSQQVADCKVCAILIYVFANQRALKQLHSDAVRCIGNVDPKGRRIPIERDFFSGMCQTKFPVKIFYKRELGVQRHTLPATSTFFTNFFRLVKS